MASGCPRRINGAVASYSSYSHTGKGFLATTGGAPRVWRGGGGVVAALHVVLLTVAPGRARGAS